jgi:hypothetical protein
MLLSRMSLYGFSLKKAIGQPGIIVDADSFRKTGVFPRIIHWLKNKQAFGDMERHLADFNRKNSHTKFLSYNNLML